MCQGTQNIVKEIKQYQEKWLQHYRGWTQIEYQNKHYNINQKDEGTRNDRGRDGGTKFGLRIKEQETRLTLQEHDDDDDDDFHGCDILLFSLKMATYNSQNLQECFIF